MSRLLLANIEPGTTDDEIREFLEKYGFPAPDGMEHAEGDGSRPGVVATFNTLDPSLLSKLQERINNLYWKKRTLSAQVLQDRFA